MLRTAATPVDDWLAGANPDLFAQARRLCASEAAASQADRRLGSVVREVLTAAPGLSTGRRRALGRVARRPGRLLEMDPTEIDELGALEGAGRSWTSRLRQSLECSRACHEDVAELEAVLTVVLEDEQRRTQRLPGQMAHRSAVLAEMLRRQARVVLDAELQHADGDDVAGDPKRRRQHAAVLWRIVTRSATICTPRDLLAHVVPLDHTGRAVPRAGEPAAPLTFHWVEHLHGVTRDLAVRAPDAGRDDVHVGVTPLHDVRDGRVHAWRPSVEDPQVFREVSISEGPVVAALVSALSSGALPLPDLVARVAGRRSEPGTAERDGVERLVEHLTGVGVLQLSRPPSEGVVVVGDVDVATTLRAKVPSPSVAWLDVYRRPEPEPSLVRPCELERAVMLTISVSRALDDRRHLLGAGRGRTGRGPAARRTANLMDLVEQELRRITIDGPRVDRLAGPSPGGPSSELARWVDESLHDQAELRLTAQTLDGLGVPQPPALDWPVDALLRSTGSEDPAPYVLTNLAGAGMFDSRFLPALHRLGTTSAREQSYRQFLADVEQRACGRFVELVLPPMSEKADNATRRPRYTGLTTGEPDPRPYLDPAGGCRYVPLREIEIDLGEQVTARWRGERLFPVYHATRSALAPWDFIAGVLLSAGPQPHANHRLLQQAFAMRPGCRFRPRVVVADTLVLAPAEWRVTEAELWSPSSRLLDKIKHLTMLRSRLDWPRWVTVHERNSLVTLDLESLYAVGALERAWRHSSGELRVAEMMPGPDAAKTAQAPGPALEAGPRGALTETVVRFPLTSTADELARRACDSLSTGAE